MIVQNWHRLGTPARAAAISAAVDNISPDTCAHCDKRVFVECAFRPDKRHIQRSS